MADPPLVREVALDLLGEFAGDPIRKLGVRVSNLQFEAPDQASLDGWDRDDTPASPPDDDETAPTTGERHGPASGGRGQSSLTDFDP